MCVCVFLSVTEIRQRNTALICAYYKKVIYKDLALFQLKYSARTIKRPQQEELLLKLRCLLLLGIKF